MEPKPYNTTGGYSEISKLLYTKGYIDRLPYQVDRSDLTHDDGVDVVFDLKNITPEKFAEVSDILLGAAEAEAKRYPEYKWKFAKVEVKLNRNKLGKQKIGELRTYIASKHKEHDIMIYGEAALGYTLPKEFKGRPFLVQKFEDIIKIPETPSPGPYIHKQRPYIVDRLIISFRVGKENMPGW